MNEHSTDFQVAILAAAKARGWNPSQLSPAHYRTLALEVRTSREKLRGIADMLASRTATGLGLRIISPGKAAANDLICQSNQCGKYRLLQGGIPACDACVCQGAGLRSKQRDPVWFCPVIDPTTNKHFWDNRE